MSGHVRFAPQVAYSYSSNNLSVKVPFDSDDDEVLSSLVLNSYGKSTTALLSDDVYAYDEVENLADDNRQLLSDTFIPIMANEITQYLEIGQKLGEGFV